MYICTRLGLSNKLKCYLNTNLGLESLVAKADEPFRVMAHSVSATLA